MRGALNSTGLIRSRFCLHNKWVHCPQALPLEWGTYDSRKTKNLSPDRSRRPRTRAIVRVPRHSFLSVRRIAVRPSLS